VGQDGVDARWIVNSLQLNREDWNPQGLKIRVLAADEKGQNATLVAKPLDGSKKKKEKKNKEL